jgi:hypothetical protein
MAKKVKCSFESCKAAAQRIVGDCSFCNGHFCSSHRLLEDHKCQNLEDVSSQQLLLSLASEESEEDYGWEGEEMGEALAAFAGSATASSLRRSSPSSSSATPRRIDNSGRGDLWWLAGLSPGVLPENASLADLVRTVQARGV